MHDLEEFHLLDTVFDLGFLDPPHWVFGEEICELLAVWGVLEEENDELIAEGVVVEVLGELIDFIFLSVQSASHVSTESFDQIFRIVAVVLGFFLATLTL